MQSVLNEFKVRFEARDADLRAIESKSNQPTKGDRKKVMSQITAFRREVFAINLASGMRHREAAILAGYAPKNASRAGRLLAKAPLVAERIGELRKISGGITVCDNTGKMLGVFYPARPLPTPQVEKGISK